jgi:phage tail-like protein
MSDRLESFGPLFTFKFEVTLELATLDGKDGPAPVTGSFSECTGLEATMEQKVIKTGGHNYGTVLRAGPVTFATVVLKRGISPDGGLVTWFTRVAGGSYAERATVTITLKGPPEDEGGEARDVLTYKLENAMPVKFKAADFNAKATDVGIEELHLVHEGLTLEPA